MTKFIIDRILIVSLILAGFAYYQHERTRAIQFQEAVEQCLVENRVYPQIDAVWCRNYVRLTGLHFESSEEITKEKP